MHNCHDDLLMSFIGIIIGMYTDMDVSGDQETDMVKVNELLNKLIEEGIEGDELKERAKVKCEFDKIAKQTIKEVYVNPSKKFIQTYTNDLFGKFWLQHGPSFNSEKYNNSSEQ